MCMFSSANIRAFAQSLHYTVTLGLLALTQSPAFAQDSLPRMAGNESCRKQSAHRSIWSNIDTYIRRLDTDTARDFQGMPSHVRGQRRREADWAVDANEK